MTGMTVDEAIQVLTSSRELLGGDAPLVMADGLGARLEVSQSDGAIYVCDLDDDGGELEPACAKPAG
jgi:hypothetical protein